MRVSWIKTKIQAFGDILDAAIQSLPVCGEDVEVTETFTYLGSVFHSSASCESEVNRRLGRAWGAMNSLDGGVWRSRYLCRRTKVRVFRALVLPVLLYSCETWTLTSELRRRLNSFSTMALRRILGYRWSDRKSNHDVLKEAGMRLVTCMIRERQLRLYGHVARLPESDPVHQILSCRDPRDRSRPVGRPHPSWLRPMEEYLKDVKGVTGLASAWSLAKRNPRRYRSKVDAAKRCLGVCSHTLNLRENNVESCSLMSTRIGQVHCHRQQPT